MPTTHTPGPWEAVSAPEEGMPERTHYIVSAKGALGYWRGGKARHTDCNWVLDEADARLIAAAPDLLDVLREIVEYRGGAETAIHDVYVMDRVHAAIAKAEGL